VNPAYFLCYIVESEVLFLSPLNPLEEAVMRSATPLLGPLAILLCLSLVTFGMAGSAQAYSSFFTSRCSSCHSDDTSTCNGCHHHRGAISATANADVYAPGDPLTVTLDGGNRTGWIRGILYDHNSMVVALEMGPTGTGDDGLGNPVIFPVDLETFAPQAVGEYAWEAAWFGHQGNVGGDHIETRTPVTIVVDDTGTGIPDWSPIANSSWSRLKSLY